MGTYKSIRIDIDPKTDAQTLSEIVNFLNKDDSTTTVFCLNKWSEETKWWAEDLVIEASKKFPKVMFRLRNSMGHNSDVIYLNGLGLNYDFIVFNQFPSPTQMKSALKRYETYKKKKAEQEAAKQELQKQIQKENLKSEIEKLQQKLSTL